MAIVAFLSCFALISASKIFPEFDGFDYSDQGENWTWEEVHNCESSKTQSPLEMLSDDKASTATNQYMFARYDKSHVLMRKFNTTIVLTPINDNGLGYLYYITTLNQAGTFRLDNIRFRTPAEHVINNYRAAMEVQLFHAYGFSELPVNDKVVVSLLFEADESQDALPDQLMDIILNTPNATYSTEELDMTKYLTMETFQMNYFYYLGSLTYPYCSSSYNWIIIDKIFKAPAAQINELQSQYYQIYNQTNPEQLLINQGNYRNLQDRTGRYIRYNLGISPDSISNSHQQPKQNKDI